MFNIFESKKSEKKKNTIFNFSSSKNKELKKKKEVPFSNKVFTYLSKLMVKRLGRGRLEYARPLAIKEKRTKEIAQNKFDSRMHPEKHGGPSAEEIRESALKLAKQFGWKESPPNHRSESARTQPESKDAEEKQEDNVGKTPSEPQKNGIPLFLSKKVEIEMRNAGIREEDINKLPVEKLWDLYQQKILEKELKNPEEEKIYTPEEISEEFSIMQNMWEDAYDKMDALNDDKRTTEIMDLTANAGDDPGILEDCLQKNTEITPEEKLFIEVSIQLKKYRNKGKELLYEVVDEKND